MPNKGQLFVQEFVLSFGFLGGLFTWAGVDPEEEVLRAFLRVSFPNNESMVSTVIVLFVVVSALVSVLGTLAMAGKWGLLVVGLAWISGFVMPQGGSLTILAAICLVAALIIGPAVCDHS